MSPQRGSGVWVQWPPESLVVLWLWAQAPLQQQRLVLAVWAMLAEKVVVRAALPPQAEVASLEH